MSELRITGTREKDVAETKETLKNSAPSILDHAKSITWSLTQLHFRLFSVCPNFKFSTNLNDIVVHSNPDLKHMIGWNINDVQQERSMKQWILENVDDL
jgi:hypothetical protein